MNQAATLPLSPSPTVEAVRPEAPPTFRDIPWRWSDLIIGLAPLVAVRVGSWLIAPDAMETLPRWSWIGMRALGLVWMLVFPLALTRWRLRSIPLPGIRRVVVEGLIALALLPVLFGTVMLFNFQWQRVGLDRAGSTTPLEAIARSSEIADTVTLAILAVLVAPLAEELFYRGFLYGALRRRVPIALAVLVQGLIFGLLHPFHVLGLATVTVGACLLALVYEWRRSLVAPVLLHAGQNLVRMLMITTAAIAFNATADLGLSSGPHERGQVVRSLVPGGAAELGGLQPGDIITAVAGAEFIPGDLPAVIESYEAGDQVTLQYLRDGQPAEAQVTLKKRQE